MAIRDGLAALGTERLVLAIHDQSFPSDPDEDIGRGSPYGKGARALLHFVAGLGFDGVQLGPQGDTALVDPSPYDGALLAKSPMSIALATLREAPDWAELGGGFLEPLVAARPAGDGARVHYAYAWHAAQRTLDHLHQRFSRDPERFAPLVLRFSAYRQRHGGRLCADAEFEALSAAHGTDDWRRWPGPAEGGVDRCLHRPPVALADAARRRRAQLRADHAAVIERFLFGQFILDEQHRWLRNEAARAGPHQPGRSALGLPGTGSGTILL